MDSIGKALAKNIFGKLPGKISLVHWPTEFFLIGYYKSPIMHENEKQPEETNNYWFEVVKT